MQTTFYETLNDLLKSDYNMWRKWRGGGGCGIRKQVSLCSYVTPMQTEDLIKALQDLENAASGDATVRQKIASLPQEVQDVSLLEKITGENLKRQPGAGPS